MLPVLFNTADLTSVGDGSVTERGPEGKKTVEHLSQDADCDIFDRLQLLVKEIEYLGSETIQRIVGEFIECRLELKPFELLGEYSPRDRSIRYYEQTQEKLRVVMIHERFHAIHHLTPDSAGAVWGNFVKTDSFYLELLAQLFTWIYIREDEPWLITDFNQLNKYQPLIYKTYRIFEHYTKIDAISLYWLIRNKASTNPILIMLKQLLQTINNQIPDELLTQIAFSLGIRRTITRFREHPFLYFTESDIHASLKQDILDGNSGLFYKFLMPDKKVETSLVHLEYPTNFAFSRKDLTNCAESEYANKQRGNFDLVVLNSEYINFISKLPDIDIIGLLQGIIAKDIRKYNDLLSFSKNVAGDELLYAVEVKFLHLGTSKVIVSQIRMDNQKLHCAQRKSQNIRPINLIFCYYSSNSPIKDINALKRDIGAINENVLNILIVTRIDEKAEKDTPKPQYYFKSSNGVGPDWVGKIVAGYDSW